MKNLAKFGKKITWGLRKKNVTTRQRAKPGEELNPMATVQCPKVVAISMCFSVLRGKKHQEKNRTECKPTFGVPKTSRVSIRHGKSEWNSYQATSIHLSSKQSLQPTEAGVEFKKHTSRECGFPY